MNVNISLVLGSVVTLLLFKFGIDLKATSSLVFDVCIAICASEDVVASNFTALLPPKAFFDVRRL